MIEAGQTYVIYKREKRYWFKDVDLHNPLNPLDIHRRGDGVLILLLRREERTLGRNRQVPTLYILLEVKGNEAYVHEVVEPKKKWRAERKRMKRAAWALANPVRAQVLDKIQRNVVS